MTCSPVDDIHIVDCWKTIQLQKKEQQGKQRNQTERKKKTNFIKIEKVIY